MDRLLIEIGTEEIPAGYIEPALAAFRSRLLEKLDQLRIGHGSASVYGTPRRLALMVEDVADRQTALTTEMTGPPERVAFDENKQPTKAAQKFAEKAGLSVNRLQIKETEKGRYLCAQKTDRGQATSTVLKQVLPDLILGLPFPKTMRWGDLRIAFARPVHSVVALYGKKVVGFAVGDVKSGRQTFGHRFLQPGKIKLNHPDDYLDALRRAWVIADMDERRAMMETGMQRAVDAVSGNILADDELVRIVTHLVEYPEVVRGGFDEKFLQLPREILVTAMREHQRYFAVVDNDNRMMPHFVAVSNNRARDMGVVAAGNERVLKARLEDARFFYNTDLQVSQDACVDKLKAVLFQAELGSVYDKVERVRKLAATIADRLFIDDTAKQHLDRAAWLCKSDLVSHVVDEFPKLQGVMGRIYAEVAGEPEPVARAIEEHYRPTHSGGPLPETIEGSVLGIAEKLDTLCGCFHVGLIPTGASDPYALRRQGIGLIAIARENGFAFSLTDLIREGMANFGDPDTDKGQKAVDGAYGFLKNRMAHLLEEEGISKDLVAAVVEVSADNIVDVWQRARGIVRMKAAPDFESLAVAFKRVVNIIRKADTADTHGVEVNRGFFDHASESALFDAFIEVEKNVDEHLAAGRVTEAFTEVAGLRGAVDDFFDNVMVMADDVKIRKNRLALLKRISDLFARLADFSRIST